MVQTSIKITQRYLQTGNLSTVFEGAEITDFFEIFR